jgi:hypothetical protein
MGLTVEFFLLHKHSTTNKPVDLKIAAARLSDALANPQSPHCYKGLM